MSKPTVWRKTLDLYERPDVDWTRFEPVETIADVQCYCAGGALAEVITGDAKAMYAGPLDVDFSPELDAAMRKFADHVGAPSETRLGNEIPPYSRVYQWNDRKADSLGDVLKALAELDELESAK